jgi:hypothetical protein
MPRGAFPDKQAITGDVELLALWVEKVTKKTGWKQAGPQTETKRN